MSDYLLPQRCSNQLLLAEVEDIVKHVEHNTEALFVCSPS